MSDYHILQGQANGNRYQVIYHLPVPDTNNAVGVNHREIMAAQLAGGWVSAVPHIAAPEIALIEAGELYEFPFEYLTNPSLLLAAKRDELDAKFVVLSAGVIARLEAQFEFYGLDRDVP